MNRLVLLFFIAFAYSMNIGVAANFLVSEKAYRTLSQAEERIAQGAYREADELLDQALDGRALNDYERALFERLAGAAAIGLDDYAAATRHFEQAARAELPAGVLEQVKHQLAQLYLHAARYDDALVLLEKWMGETAQPSAAACFLIAAAYAGLEQLTTALEWGERGLLQADILTEHQSAFVAGLNVALEHYPRASELLEQLVEQYPQTAQHWRQLSAVYGELGRADSALAVAEIGRLQGVLTTDDDIERLASLYLHRELPHKAAVLLEDALHTGAIDFDAARYRLLADAWTYARDYARALAPLEDAMKLLHAAGKPDEEADVRLFKGVVHTHLGQHAAAAQEFERCLKFEQTREAAVEWLAYLKPQGRV